jgi:hypothetical protein
VVKQGVLIIQIYIDLIAIFTFTIIGDSEKDACQSIRHFWQKALFLQKYAPEIFEIARETLLNNDR